MYTYVIEFDNYNDNQRHNQMEMDKNDDVSCFETGNLENGKCLQIYIFYQKT